MARIVIAALALVALVACASAQAAPKLTVKLATPACPGCGVFCHQSCYKGVVCGAALDTKVKLFNAAQIPVRIEKTACGILGCDAIIRYSFASEKDWKTYQTMEKKDPVLFKIYDTAGLKSAAPQGLLKNGTCATLKGF